jgi:cell division protein FtsN
MGVARGRRGDSRTGTMLVLAGVAGVLTVTFVAGVWTGRHWPLLTGRASSGTPVEATPGARRAPAERPKQAEPLPALTFYHELTAPLTAPPPPPRPARPPRPADKAEGGPPTASAPPPAGPTGLPSVSGAQFTVQVGSYQARGPADAMRTTLAAAGHDARVVEAQTPAGLRYRVQVGAFPTREAAREAATRLAGERSMPAFVTPR